MLSSDTPVQHHQYSRTLSERIRAFNMHSFSIRKNNEISSALSTAVRIPTYEALAWLLRW